MTHTTRTTRNRFTLLEMIVAMAIMAMVVALLATGGGQAFESWRRINAEQSRFSELLTLDRTVDAMFRNIIPFNWRDVEQTSGGKTMPAFHGEPGRIRFAYRHTLNNADDGALSFAGLCLEEGRLKAVYQQRPFLDWERPAAATRQECILAQEVDSITFLYANLDVTSGKVLWLDQWDTVTPTTPPRHVPLAILLTVRWKDGREYSWLRRTSGSAQYSRYGNWVPLKENSP